MEAELIAPCGLNCRLCRAYGRAHKPCPGCRLPDRNKANACVTCRIKNCTERAEHGLRFCYECARFPCKDLLHLDKRYRTRYGVSAIGNLERIRQEGVERFVLAEQGMWACPACGATLCMHKAACPSCWAVRAGMPGKPGEWVQVGKGEGG